MATRPDCRSLSVVGDDAPLIYSFRGATVCNILDFPTWFGSPARRITLEQNGCSPSPLDAANPVIAEVKEGFCKQSWRMRAGAQKPLLVPQRFCIMGRRRPVSATRMPVAPA